MTPSLKTIIKVMEHETKCSITLKELRGLLGPTLKSITDTEYEYEELMNVVPRFYRDNYKKPNECLIIQDHKGNNWYAESTWNSHSVSMPDRAYDEGVENGLLYTVHNHPEGASFQSPADYEGAAADNEKYMVTVGRKEIALTKNSNGHMDPYKVSDICYDHTAQQVKRIRETNYEGIRETMDRISKGDISPEEGRPILDKALNNYARENGPKMVRELNSLFEENNITFNTTIIQW